MKGAYPITSIDIHDFDVLPERELYKCRPRSYVMLPRCKSVIFYDHLDGAFSFCLSMLGDVVHLAAWESVHPLVKKDDTPSPESDIT